MLPCNLIELVHKACETVKSNQDESQTDISLDVTGTIPNIFTDPTRVVQILRTLIGIAVNLTKNNSSVQISLRTLPDKESSILISIGYDGADMPLQVLQTWLAKDLYNQSNCLPLQGESLIPIFFTKQLYAC